MLMIYLNNMIKFNSNIFKAYDIRGKYPEEINEKFAYALGVAFVKFLKKTNKKQKLKIVIGRDNRLSSPCLFKNLSKGIMDQGADVVNIGLSPTPLLYFSVAYYKFDGGINITASHNPGKYNGFKIVRENAIPVSENSGLKELKKIILKENLPQKQKNKGQKINKNPIQDYLKFNLKEVNLKKIIPLKIVIDTANAVPGIIVPKILEKLPIKIDYLFLKLDGKFPNHSPDPLNEKNLKAIKKQIKLKKADLGVAFDGDGDRIIFIDEKGKAISADLITAFIAKSILRKKPGQKILYDPRSSNIIKETVKENNGITVIGKVGHSLIKEKMRKHNISFAGELSGHYYLKNHYFCESPFFVLFKILEEMSTQKKKISELMKPFKKYYHSGEINFKIKNKEKILKILENKYKKGKILKIDGLRIDFNDWWFNVRPSNTEPVLRLVTETKTKKSRIEKEKEITKIILKQNQI